MAAIEVNASSSICRKCGTAYGRLKGYFPVSYGFLYRGTGYLPYCKECVDAMFNAYLAECKDAKMAVRQMCRKLDLYWNEKLFESAEKQSTPRSIMTSYMGKINGTKFANMSYDDTLKAEDALWLEPVKYTSMQPAEPVITEPDDDIEVPEEVVVFWGPGYTPSMYMELEQRRAYWMSKYPDDAEFDIGTEALIRQICSLEIDINRDRAAGKSADKNINTLNTLLGSASLKPAQKKSDDYESSLANTPLGVWLYRYENKRPLPEVDKDLQDVNGVKKYIFTWMGHLCKMMNIKNGYTKLYDAEVDRLRVERPEYDGDDDETLLNDAYSGVSKGGDDD